MYIPANYQKINIFEGTQVPSTLKRANNSTFDYWCRCLYQRVQSVIKFENLPLEWNGRNLDFLYFCLFKFGFVIAFNSDEFGKAFQPCTLSGYNFYYQYTNAIVSNPAIKNSLKLKIIDDISDMDDNCGALIKMTPDYKGIFDIIYHYAEHLALADAALNVSLINSKVPYILGAKNKANAATLKTLIDKINKGESLAIFDKAITDDDINGKSDPFTQVKLFSSGDYITDKLIKDSTSILHAFDTEIGIPTLPYEKRERFVASEAESKQIESKARCLEWIDTLNHSLTVVNSLLGTDIKAIYNDIGGGENVSKVDIDRLE